MIKTIFLTVLLAFSLSTLDLKAADSGPPPEIIKKTNPTYAEAKTLVKSKKFDKAVVMLEELLKDSKNSSNPDILNDYAYSLRNLKQYDKAEKFYLAALKINPKHVGANEYLGELYLQTKRPEEAKKRLEVLKTCNCEEYKELKEKIEKQTRKENPVIQSIEVLFHLFHFHRLQNLSPKKKNYDFHEAHFAPLEWPFLFFP